MNNSTTSKLLTGKLFYNCLPFIQKRIIKICVAAILSLVLNAPNVQAQVVTEDFSYAASSLITASGWTAISGGGTNAITVTSPGLTYSSYAGSGVGNAVSLVTSGEDDSKTFTAITSGTVYYSAMINCTAAQAGGDYCLALNGSVFSGRLYLRSSGAGFVIGVSKTSDAAPTYDATVRTFGTTYFIVVKYTYVTGATNDNSNLWINPAVGGTETAATVANVTSASADASSLSSITLRQGSAGNAATVRVDGIRVGTTWASVTPSVSTVSDPPTGVSAVAGNAEATVSFTAPVSDGGSTITSYTATSTPGSFTGTVNQSGSGSVVVAGLTNGTAYTFTVTATNGVGTSAASNTSNSVTPFTVPDAPTIGTAVAGNGQATVPFTAPVFDGGSPITSYTATSTPGGLTGILNQAGSGSIVVSGLTNGTPYTFTVTATNAAGPGAASSASNSVTPTSGPTVPDAPGIGTVTAGNGQATVPFTAPVSNGGSAITSYTATSTPGGFTGTVNQSGDGSIVVSGLSNGTAYTFTVTATNGIGTSAPSNPSNSVTPATVPDAPTIGTATAGDGQATVSFIAPVFNGGADITSYTATSSPGGFTGFVNQAGSGSIIVPGLTNGTPYTFTVTATNSAGTSSASSASNSITPASVPDAPIVGTATAGNGQASIDFTAPSFDGGSAIISYTATSTPGGITGSVNQSGSGTITVTGLSNGTAYTFTVTATNAIGTSTASAASNSVTPVTIPGAPTGVTAVGGDQEATVSFIAPASNGGSVITSYTATSSPGGITGTVNQSGSGSIVVTGLTNGTPYTFTVTATNAVGAGPASTVSNSVTPAFVLPVIAKWTFEGTTISGTGQTPTINSTTAQQGGNTTGSVVSGSHASASTGWSSVSGNGSAQAINSNNWAINDYVQFQVNTQSYSQLQVSYDHTGSNTGPRDFILRYSTDGTNFTTFGSQFSITNDSWSPSGAPKPASNRVFDLSSVTELNNQSAVYLRLVVNSGLNINGAAIASGGTSRIDNFTVSGLLVNDYTITATAQTAGGSISPAGAVVVTAGADQTFTITPDVCNDIAEVVIDGVTSLGAVTEYTFENVSANHTIDVYFNPSTSTTWTGLTNSNWDEAGNWSSCVPNASLEVTIAAGTPNAPVLNVDAEVNSLTIADGATLSLSNKTLTINGGFTGTASSTLTGSDEASLVLNSSASLISSAPIRLKNLVINGGVTTLASAVEITGGTATADPGEVSVLSGAQLESNGFLTIKSNSFGTGRVAQGDDAGNYITGDVTVERFIPNNGFRSWRFLAVPTTGSQTIRQAWQEGVANPSPLQNNLPGFGTLITGTGPVGAAQAAGFDGTIPKASLLTWGTNAWVDATGTNVPIANIKGYMLFLRGNRTAAINGPVTSTSSTVLRTTGGLYQGTQSIPSFGASSFNSVGNLYASAIDFTQLQRTGGTQNLFYIWDSKKQSGASLGAYQTFSATNNFECTLGGGSYTVGQVNTTIESGQAFFVSTTTAGTLSLTEGSKIANGGSLGFRPVAPASLVKIDSRLYAAGSSDIADANVVVFNDKYSNNITEEDAVKMPNLVENFAVQQGDKTLSIEGRHTVTTTDEIVFNMWNLKQQQYNLEFVPKNLQTAGLEATLVDSYLNTRTPVSLESNTTVSFTVDANTASAAANRFKIVLSKIKPIAETKAAYTIAPNPVENGQVNLQFKNRPAGKYSIRIITVAGQPVMTRTLVHAGGNAVQTLNLPSRAASGAYMVEITAPDKTKTIENLLVK
ncbi:MAG TPA: fibronectin type III domain-containing protein [Ferruginibacter sp.]|nr:fibronectin type III domain-containing protein [Ferruginibacter sp.]